MASETLFYFALTRRWFRRENREVSNAAGTTSAGSAARRLSERLPLPRRLKHADPGSELHYASIRAKRPADDTPETWQWSVSPTRV
jgi:hypothetical protein